MLDTAVQRLLPLVVSDHNSALWLALTSRHQPQKVLFTLDLKVDANHGVEHAVEGVRNIVLNVEALNTSAHAAWVATYLTDSCRKDTEENTPRTRHAYSRKVDREVKVESRPLVPS